MPTFPSPTPAPLWTAAVALPLAVAGALSLLRNQVSAADAALVLVLVVVAVSAAGRRGPGVAAALSGALWFDFYLTAPYSSLAIDDRDDVETMVLLTLVGLAVCELAQWGRRQQARASEREGHLAGVIAAARMAATADVAPAALATVVAAQVRETLGAAACRWVPGRPGNHPELHADGRVTRGGHEIDVDRVGLPTDDVLVVPTGRGGQVTGYFEVVASERTVWPDRERRQVAVALAEQVAPAQDPVADGWDGPT